MVLAGSPQVGRTCTRFAGQKDHLQSEPTHGGYNSNRHYALIRHKLAMIFDLAGEIFSIIDALARAGPSCSDDEMLGIRSIVDFRCRPADKVQAATI